MGDERLSAQLRRAPAPRRTDRRPAGPPPRLHDRHSALRDVLTAVRVRLDGRRAGGRPRCAGRVGRRHGTHRALHPPEHLRRGHRAQQGPRPLVRQRRLRRHGGAADRRPAHRRPRLGVGVLPERARRAGAARPEPRSAAREPHRGTDPLVRSGRRPGRHGGAPRLCLRRRRGAPGRMAVGADAGPAGRLRRTGAAVRTSRGPVEGTPRAVATAALPWGERREPRGVPARRQCLRDVVHALPVRAGRSRLLAAALRPLQRSDAGDGRDRLVRRTGPGHPCRPASGRGRRAHAGRGGQPAAGRGAGGRRVRARPVPRAAGLRAGSRCLRGRRFHRRADRSGGAGSGVASGINTAAFQIGGAFGVAVVSSVAVSYTSGADRLAALTAGYRAAFVACVVLAVVGTAVALVLLGRRRRPAGRSPAAPGRTTRARRRSRTRSPEP